MIIIAIVCSATTLLLIVIILIINRCSSPSTPLPTIQPLAHHRERHLAQSQNPYPNNSTVCLLPATPSPPINSPPSRPHRLPSNPTHRSRSVTSHSTKNSRNRRGVPHGPHGEIQIVLPAPLALYAGPGPSTSTLSLVDKWAYPTTCK